MTTCAAVRPCLAASFRDDGIVEQSRAAERRPGLRGDAALGVERAQRALLKARMQLDLVDRRRHAGLADDPLQMLGGEIGDADRFREPLLAQLDQRAPRLDIEPALRRRPMDEVEVDIVELEPLQAFARGAERGLVAVRVVPELGGDERLAARDPARASPCPTPASLP